MLAAFLLVADAAVVWEQRANVYGRGNDRVDEEEIERQVDELRVKLLDEMKRGAGGVNARGLKPHQVHELAAAKLGMLPPSPLPGFFSLSIVVVEMLIDCGCSGERET